MADEGCIVVFCGLEVEHSNIFGCGRGRVDLGCVVDVLDVPACGSIGELGRPFVYNARGAEDDPGQTIHERNVVAGGYFCHWDGRRRTGARSQRNEGDKRVGTNSREEGLEWCEN